MEPERAITPITPITEGQEPSTGSPPDLRGTLHPIDPYFTHLSTRKVAEINGTLDRALGKTTQGVEAIEKYRVAYRSRAFFSG